MNVLLRPWNLIDAANLERYANNPSIAANMTDKFPHPFTSEHAEKFIITATSSPVINIFAIDVDGEAVGGIGIHPQIDILCKNAELGYWLGEPFWGKGIITKAITLMTEYAFKNFDINRIYARPFGTNIASQRALEKAGFILEARFEKTLFKKGEYLDELIYATRK
jgi:RimJ/RimL family protein N-acetyltransferase